MDPNAGDIRDAILVHCEMSNRATCVLPMPAETEKLISNEKQDEQWLSEMNGGIKVHFL